MIWRTRTSNVVVVFAQSLRMHRYSTVVVDDLGKMVCEINAAKKMIHVNHLGKKKKKKKKKGASKTIDAMAAATATDQPSKDEDTSSFEATLEQVCD